MWWRLLLALLWALEQAQAEGLGKLSQADDGGVPDGRLWISDGHQQPNNPHRDVDMETRGRFQLVGDPQDNNCSLGIRDAKRKDTGRYFFRIQSSSVRHSYKDKQLSLWLTVLTEVPVVDVPETLQSGCCSNLTCLVPWACQQVLDPEANPTLVLPITPSPEDHGANLTCQATFPRVEVTVERNVQLNVSYAPQNLSISVSWGAGTGRTGPLIPGSVSVNV
ncbi:sialic acid-binding Ig-like lectin 9 [Dipodomys spectabilis]|uniref:sialic acid-binding Ig-like lectin 9 n=1 Tax=Dipodomys spectabilis TaxID=105255 RepID=UPI001C541EE2|nr:sialic acid-binding Ig-like lectin 9 [Dipodomys spectabilis]